MIKRWKYYSDREIFQGNWGKTPIWWILSICAGNFTGKSFLYGNSKGYSDAIIWFSCFSEDISEGEWSTEGNKGVYW